MWIFIQKYICLPWLDMSTHRSHPSVATNTNQRISKADQSDRTVSRIKRETKRIYQICLNFISSKVEQERWKWGCSFLKFCCLSCHWLLWSSMVETSQTFPMLLGSSTVETFETFPMLNLLHKSVWPAGGAVRARRANAPWKCFPTILPPIGLAGRQVHCTLYLVQLQVGRCTVQVGKESLTAQSLLNLISLKSSQLYQSHWWLFWTRSHPWMINSDLLISAQFVLICLFVIWFVFFKFSDE